MELWVIITISAAFFQTVRTALQKNLKDVLSTNAVSFSRFIFGLPWACLYAFALTKILGISLPHAHGTFLMFCSIAGVAQIISTSLLIHLFSFKNFMIGTTYVKTEAILTAIIGIIIFGEHISHWGFAAIVTGIIGVMMISAAKEKLTAGSLIKSIGKKEALIGLASGFGFAISSLCLREAAISLESESFLMQAAMTLMITLMIQSFLMAIYMAAKETEQFKVMIIHWKKTSAVGITSVIGSACWFTAFTLAAAAYVKTVGQIEVLFTICMSMLIFKETVNKIEIAGIVLIIASVLMLIYS